MTETRNIRKSICEIGKILYDRELTDSSGGNISVRDGDKVYINPRRTGHDKQWQLEEDDIIVTDMCKVPIIGEKDAISREAATHYYVYHNFPDIGAVIHGHPIFIMTFGAAHMDLPAVSEGTRAVLGEQPITNTPEVLPGSTEQAEEVVKNFKKRRETDPEAPLICSLPYHGTFAAGGTINDAFMYTEVANNCAKILVYRQAMFGNDPKADFSIHRRFTREEIASIEESKDVCPTGFVYRDAYGKETVYGNGKADSSHEMIQKITEEVLKKIGSGR
jgi:L-fuculose-phosphate aldolase